MDGSRIRSAVSVSCSNGDRVMYTCAWSSHNFVICVAQQQTTCSTRPDPNGKRPPCDDTASIEGLLRFESMKAVSYPGGDRYKTYDQCEQNPFAEGCDG